MAFERKWLRVSQPFISDGGQDGTVIVGSTSGFKAKQKINISSIGQSPIVLEIKRVLSPTTMLVGPIDKGINSRTDISNYTVTDSAIITAEEQSKKHPTEKDREAALYEQEPTVAKRVILVDEFGRFYETTNPLPVQLSDGSIDIGTVNAELEVQLSHQDDVPDIGDVADSVQVGDGNEILEVNPDGSITIRLGELPGIPFVHKEASSITDNTETTVSIYNSTTDGIKFKRLHGMAMTFGIWRVYKDSIDASNLVSIYQTSPTTRNADLILSNSESIDNGESIIITFQAERYRTRMLGSSSETFVRLEGYQIT